MKKKFYNILFFLITITFFNVSFGYSGNVNEKLTIKELSNKVKQIDNNKNLEEKKIQNLKKELFIKRFFKSDLFKEQKEKLKILVLEYKENKDKLEKNLTKTNLNNRINIIKDLLNNEKEIYKKLLPYIEKSKYEEYKNYIRKDIELVNNKLILEIKKTDTQKKINKKLKTIKKQIKQHKKFISKKIGKLINKKIEEKLNIFTTKEKFLKLTKIQKKQVFIKLEQKLKEKLKKLKQKNIKDENKIEIYNIIIDKVIEFQKKY